MVQWPLLAVDAGVLSRGSTGSSLVEAGHSFVVAHLSLAVVGCSAVVIHLSLAVLGCSAVVIHLCLAVVGLSPLAIHLFFLAVVGLSALVFAVCLVSAVNSHAAVSLTVFGAAPLVAEVGLSPVEVGCWLLLSGESLLPVLLDVSLQLPIPAINHMFRNSNLK